MNLLCIDDVLLNPKEYVQDILQYGFQDYADGWKVFKNVQARSDDEFEKNVLELFPNYEAKWNFEDSLHLIKRNQTLFIQMI